MARHQAFVGDKTCQSCHLEEWEAWKGSHHDFAIAPATEEYVRGDFNNIEFHEEDEIYLFYRENGRYMVDAPDQDGNPVSYEIIYTFGWEPLQQYLIDIGQGKFQALHISWDTEKEQWFTLQPDIQPPHDDWLHWTQGAMNWNTMCADCHSTNLQQNFIAETDSFHTTWSVLNVSCEACHGPGESHVQFMNSPESDGASLTRIREDLNLTHFTSQMDEINTCAPCHSLRQKLTDDYIHGDNYFDHFDPMLPVPDNYFADGQIREEVFVFSSFLQSKMYTHGVKCTDCHNPHTLELKANITDNSLCMQCHEPRYNKIEHHFHQMNTDASQCVNCHMTGRYYMEVDYRRDHSFRVPRPDQSERFGTPNACNDCHTDKTPSWASQAIEEWYGTERSPHFSDILLKADAQEPGAQKGLKELIADNAQPEIIRATAIWYMGNFPDDQSLEILEEAMNSESPMIRSSAARALDNLSPETRKPLLEKALADSVRSVRVSAFQGLLEFSEYDFQPPYRDHFNDALVEYKTFLDVNAYFPSGQMNRARFFEQQGNIDEATDAYQKALTRDPYFNPARINLANIYNSLGENTKAIKLLNTVIEQEPENGQVYYSLGLLKSELNQLEQAVSYFEQASTLMPEHSRVLYNLAIAHQTLGNPDEAEEAYLRSLDLEPENGDYLYGVITLYMQQQNYHTALEFANRLNSLYPNNPNILRLIQIIEREL